MSKNSKLNIIQMDDAPWYKEGLKFECTGCGKCCTGQPGYVWITEDEIEALAVHLDISVEKVMRTYIRQKDNRYSLIEKRSQNFDCVFLKDNRCSIYEVRPKQCRTFPWWIQNLQSKSAWDEAAKGCEGIHKDAKLFSLKEIQEGLNS